MKMLSQRPALTAWRGPRQRATVAAAHEASLCAGPGLSSLFHTIPMCVARPGSAVWTLPRGPDPEPLKPQGSPLAPRGRRAGQE